KMPDTMAVQRYDIPAARDGRFEVRYWSPINTPVCNAQGEVTHILFRAEDVTEFVQNHTGPEPMEYQTLSQGLEIQSGNRRLQEMNLTLECIVQIRTRELREHHEYLVSLLMAIPVPIAVMRGPEL